MFTYNKRKTFLFFANNLAPALEPPQNWWLQAAPPPHHWYSHGLLPRQNIILRPEAHVCLVLQIPVRFTVHTSHSVHY